jgi:hypothetical protein
MHAFECDSCNHVFCNFCATSPAHFESVRCIQCVLASTERVPKIAPATGVKQEVKVMALQPSSSSSVTSSVAPITGKHETTAEPEMNSKAVAVAQPTATPPTDSPPPTLGQGHAPRTDNPTALPAAPSISAATEAATTMPLTTTPADADVPDFNSMSVHELVVYAYNKGWIEPIKKQTHGVATKIINEKLLQSKKGPSEQAREVTRTAVTKARQRLERGGPCFLLPHFCVLLQIKPK